MNERNTRRELSAPRCSMTARARKAQVREASSESRTRARTNNCCVSVPHENARRLRALNGRRAVRLHFQTAAYLQLMTYRAHAHECSG